MNNKIGLRTEDSAPGTRQRGFTLIELIVVITIVVILAKVLLDRIWFYQEQAEKAAMEQVAGALQTALVLQYAQLLTHGQMSEAKTLTTENPLRWLMQKPDNYSGEFYGVTPGAVVPGNWVFDLKSRELIYVPYRTEYFVAGTDGKKLVRYHARLEYDRVPGRASNAGAATNPAASHDNSQGLSGVLFEPVAPYQWFPRKE